MSEILLKNIFQRLKLINNIDKMFLTLKIKSFRYFNFIFYKQKNIFMFSNRINLRAVLSTGMNKLKFKPF